MGEYLPPPLGIMQLAAYLEKVAENVEIRVLDCQAQNIDWKGLEGESARLKTKTYRYLAGEGVMKELKNLFWRKPNA